MIFIELFFIQLVISIKLFKMLLIISQIKQKLMDKK